MASDGLFPTARVALAFLHLCHLRSWQDSPSHPTVPPLHPCPFAQALLTLLVPLCPCLAPACMHARSSQEERQEAILPCGL